MIQNPGIEQEFAYDFWLIYSGKNSKKIVSGTLAPILETVLNRKVAKGFNCYIPGKNKFENIIETAEKSKKAIIVLSPERSLRKWFRYEVEIALLKGPTNTLVVRSEQGPALKCLKPLDEILINRENPKEALDSIIRKL